MTSRNEGFIRTETNHHEQEITHNMCSPTRRHTVVAARLAIPAECAMCEAEARAAGRRPAAGDVARAHVALRRLEDIVFNMVSRCELTISPVSKHF